LKYLVDTDVLSETTKPVPSQVVVDWLRKNGRDSAVSPVVLGEVEFGILILPAGRRKKLLLEWFAAGIKKLDVVSIDAATSTIWARLLAEMKRRGRTMPVKDSLIAASALQHQLHVITRNVDDYRHTGVRLINPFEAA
jgi:predicted nucleic acid-binding protein